MTMVPMMESGGGVVWKKMRSNSVAKMIYGRIWIRGIEEVSSVRQLRSMGAEKRRGRVAYLDVHRHRAASGCLALQTHGQQDLRILEVPRQSKVRGSFSFSVCRSWEMELRTCAMKPNRPIMRSITSQSRRVGRTTGTRMMMILFSIGIRFVYATN